MKAKGEVKNEKDNHFSDMYGNYIECALLYKAARSSLFNRKQGYNE